MDNLPYGADPNAGAIPDTGASPDNQPIMGGPPTLSGVADPYNQPLMGGPPTSSSANISAGGPMAYKGHYVKPPISYPSIKGVPFTDYVVQQILTTKNDHNTVANLTPNEYLDYAGQWAKQHSGMYDSLGNKMDAQERDALVGQFKNDVFQNMPDVMRATAAAEAKYKAKMGQVPGVSTPSGPYSAGLQRAGGVAQTGIAEGMRGVPGAAANILMGPTGKMLETMFPEQVKDMKEKVRSTLNPLIKPGAEKLKKSGEENIQATEESLKDHPIIKGAAEIGGGVAPYLASALVPGGPVALGMSQGGGGALEREETRINAMKPEELNALPEYQTFLKASGNDPEKAKALLIKASSEAAEEVGQIGGGLMGAIGGGGLTKTAQRAIASVVGTSVFKRVLATAGVEAGGFAGQQVAQNVLTAKATSKVTGEQREPDTLAGTDQAGIMGAVMGAIGALLHGKGKLSAAPAGKAEVPEAATNTFNEILDHPDYKVPEGADKDTANKVLSDALDELDARLGDTVSPEKKANAKARFELEWKQKNGLEAAPAATETGAPTTPAAQVDNSLAITRLQKQRDAAVKSGDKHAVSQLDRQIADLQPKPVTEEAKTKEVTPDEAAKAVETPGGMADTGITKNMHAALKELGWSDNQIFKDMTASEAQDHIDSNTGPEAAAKKDNTQLTSLLEKLKQQRKDIEDKLVGASPMDRAYLKDSMDRIDKIMDGLEAQISGKGEAKPAPAGAAPVEATPTAPPEAPAPPPEPLGQTTGHPHHKPTPLENKPQSDHHIVTAPHMDVRYPLGLLKAALKSFRASFNKDPTSEELHRQARMIAKLHGIDLENPDHSIHRREALGELLDKNPDVSPSTGEIVTKAGDYLDLRNKRSAHDVVNERIQERNKHPTQQFRDVLRKTDQIEAAKKAQQERMETDKRKAEEDRRKAEQKTKPLTDEEQLQNDLDTYQEMLAVQKKAEKEATEAAADAAKKRQKADAAKKRNLLKKQTAEQKKAADAAEAAAKQAEKESKQKAAEASRAKKAVQEKAPDIATAKQNVLKKMTLAEKRAADLKSKKGEAGAAATKKTAGKIKESREGEPAERASGVRLGLVSQPTSSAVMLNDAVSSRLKSLGKESGVKFEEIRHESLSPELQKVVDEFGTAIGHRIVVFRNFTPKLYDAAGLNYGNKFLFVNESSSHPATTIVGHEFLHQLKEDKPALYKELADEVKRQGKLDEYIKDLKDRDYEDTGIENAIEELTADATGDAFTDPEFLEALAKRNPTVFSRIADAFIKFLNTLLGKVKDLGSDKYLNEVNVFRNKLLDVLGKYEPDRAGALLKMSEAIAARNAKIPEIKAAREKVTTAAEAMEAAKDWTKKPPTIIQSFKTWKDASDSLKPSGWQKIIQKGVNTLQPLQNYNEYQERQGHKVTTAKDMFKALTVLRGRQIFEQSTDHSNYIAPILDAVRVMSKEHGMEDEKFMGLFSQWMRAQDALESNKRWELENIKLSDEAEKKRAPLLLSAREGKFKGDYMQELANIVHAPGAKLEPHAEPISGMPNAEAHHLLKLVEKEGFKNASGESLNKALDKLRERITQNQLRAKSISEADVRQQNAYKNKYYMPKSDWADEDVRVSNNVFGSPLGSFLKASYGDKPRISDDPMQRLFNKLLFSSKDVADNEATEAIWNAARDPNQNLGATVRTYDMDALAKKALQGGRSLANMQKVAAGRNSIIHNRVGKNGESLRDVITLPEDSPQLQAIKESQHPVELGKVSTAVGKATSMYGRVHTAFSPAFSLVNAVIRDGLYIPGMMVFQGRADLIPHYIGNYMKYGGPMGAWKSAFTLGEKGLRVKTFAEAEQYALANPDSYAGQLYQLEKAGGGFNFRDSFNNAKKIETLTEEMERNRRGPLNVKRWGNYLAEMQDAIATGSMMAGRVAAFAAAKEKGMTTHEAAFYAKRFLDYQQTSQGSRMLNSWFAFSRVGVTSVDAMFSALKNEKGQIDYKRAAMGMMVMGVATASSYAAIKSMMGDDKTKKLSDDALAKNVILPWGDTPIMLPIGLGMPRLAWGVAMLATRLAEGDTTAASAGRTLKNLLLENVSPLHPIETKEGADSGTIAADLAGALVPSIARPGYESFLNQTAFGSEIHEKPAYTQGYASEAGRLTTGDLYKKMATALREHVGLDVYPETLRHLMSSYDPGTITMYLKGLEKEDMETAGLEVDNTQATIFAGLFNHDLKYSAGKEYYRAKSDLQEAVKEKDVLEKAGKAIPPEIEDKVKLEREFVKASKEHSKDRKAITDNKLLGTAARSSRLAALQNEWTKTQEDFAKQAQRLGH